MTDGNERPCILIVDDEPININILTELLKSNYKIIAAKSGASALKRLSDGLRPDLILLDVIMPEISGYDVCQQLKSNPETHEIPIIFSTSAIKPEEETKGLELGAIDYISKPISPAVVIARVKSHLALQFAQRDMQRLVSLIVHELVHHQSLHPQAMYREFHKEFARTLHGEWRR